MSDHDLEQRLRAVFREVGEPASPVLRAGVAAVPDVLPEDREARLMNRFLPLGLAAAAVAVVLVLGIGILVWPSRNVGPPTGATPSAEPSESHAAGAVGNWIAYSTAPGDDQQRGTAGISRPGDIRSGSDIYLAHVGVEPRLVAGRGEEMSWNVCPRFSPDGTMLAFGTGSASGRAIRIVGVTRTGQITAPDLAVELEGAGPAPCVQWSSDGRRVAYLEGDAVIVRGLDGSTLRAGTGDPTVDDFGRDSETLVSPDGRFQVHGGALRGACTLVVEATDGSGDPRVLQEEACSYALAAWSPDGHQILHMRDISGFDFRILATSIDEPSETIVVVARVPVNHSRSWPGHGDVSWQPDQ